MSILVNAPRHVTLEGMSSLSEMRLGHEDHNYIEVADKEGKGNDIQHSLSQAEKNTQRIMSRSDLSQNTDEHRVVDIPI
ncbi:hypothetical protein L7F22_000530 [Adiantum nelumboides]|nr:hypothetical protein [Adiantum nelumboides]